MQSMDEKEKMKFLSQALYSEDIYNYMNNFYNNSAKFKTKPYIDFFWSLRSLYFSFINVLLGEVPKAKVYHAVSTGYAGLFASVCKIRYPLSRLMLTEHGIYTRERRMDITIADWADRDYDAYDPKQEISLYKNMWEESFKMVSKITYSYCNEIISLNLKNNLIQISEGAKEEKVYFVRNGINLNRFEFTERKRINPEKIRIGFLGRVVKIKDVKTFIKAADFVLKKYPNAEFIIAGPTDEDEAYYTTCTNLVFVLQREKSIKFVGSVNPAEWLQEIDVMVLTSLSEGQPLVIGEANASGVPCVATDVGGCKEMLYGGGDDKLPKSGIVTKSVNPQETAKAIITLIEDETFYNECSVAGRKRAVQFYNEETFLSQYKEIYVKNIEASGITAWQN